MKFCFDTKSLALLLQACLLLFFTSSSGQSRLGNDVHGSKKKRMFGTSLEMNADGSRMIIGADGGALDKKEGYVEVYELRKNKWHQVGKTFTSDHKEYYRGNTTSISHDGKRVLISDPRYPLDSLFGRVQIFEEEDDEWHLVGNEILGDFKKFYGWHAHLSGNGQRVALNNRHFKYREYSYWGMLIYEYDGTDWVRFGQEIIDSSHMIFSGPKMQLSGDGRRIIIGSHVNNLAYETAGRVRVYEENGGQWKQVGQSIFGNARNEQLGYSLAMSDDGKVIAMGAINNKENNVESGAVYVYREEDGAWAPMGKPIYGTGFLEHLGHSVSLDSTGQFLSVGIRGNDRSQGGKVAFFKFDGNDWKEVGRRIGVENPYDGTGNAISLSCDGKTAAIGLRRASTKKKEAGKVKVYELSEINR